MRPNRIRQFPVTPITGRGVKAVQGDPLFFFASTPSEAAKIVATWLNATRGRGWKRAKTRPSVSKGNTRYVVGSGHTVP